VTVDGRGGILTGGIWSDWTVGVAQHEGVLAAIPALGELDERALVEACLDGRREAFDVLVTRHQRAVYRLCYRFVGNHEDASDLAQEVFLRAYRGLRKFKGGSTLATWLYRIAVNVSLNRVSLKSPPMQSIDGSAPIPDHPRDPAAALIREETAARVRSAVARLPKKQRATLILRVYHDLSHQEIAAVLGTSVGAVKANFFHALTNLKKMLGSHHEESHEPPVAG
jgi:RNA polymerase sigma-70 factor (ECF subfamily)